MSPLKVITQCNQTVVTRSSETERNYLTTDVANSNPNILLSNDE